jgi:hypothetical protein
LQVGNFYVPEAAVQKFGATTSLPIAVPITAEELFGRKGTEESAVSLSKEIFWKDCVIIASKLGAALERGEANEVALQIMLAREMFKGDKLKQAVTLLTSRYQSSERNLFNCWQLLTLVKLALLYGSQDESQCLPSESKQLALAECLLNINELIGLGTGADKLDDEGQLNEAIIRVGAFFNRDQSRYLLPRYYELLLKLPKDPILRGSPDYVDVEAAFRSVAGFDLILFLALGLSVYSHYYTITNFDTSTFVLDRSTCFNKTTVAEEDAGKMLDLISTTKQDFQAAHVAKYGSDALANYFDFTYLRHKPLVKLDDKVLVPADVEFLVERITTGIYWDICDALGEPDRKRFMRFFGVVFQKYLEQLFKRAYPESSALVPRSFYDTPYDTPYGARRASDVVLFYPQQAVFIEATVGRLRMEKTMVTGDLIGFSEDIDSKVVTAAKQLHRVILDFINGNLIFPGWNADSIRRYYPVIVTVSPLPLLLTTYDKVREAVSRRGYLISSNIAELEIASIGELEMVEPLLSGGITLVNILDGKNQNFYYKRAPLSEYLYATQDKAMLRTGNAYLRTCTNEMANRVSKLLFNAKIR